MYSLGATLYHAITGYVPFDAPTVEELVEAQVRHPLTPPNQVQPEVSEATSAAIEKSLAKNPADRFLSYEEFIMALESARSIETVRQNQMKPQAPSQKSKSTSWWKR
jgi:serine/threonine-protein kinase